ncbi:MAG: GEVED domain-containing protein [Planctomycetota bacterium]
MTSLIWYNDLQEPRARYVCNTDKCRHNHSLSLAVPTRAAQGTTYTHFRCTTESLVAFTGQAPDGEVEDYRVGILVPRIYLPVVLER